MNKFIYLFALLILCSCTTIHFRSNNTVPVTFEGNPNHQKEVSIVGQKDFYFWGIEPQEEVVYVDEVVRDSGYDGISKVIIYEHKNPQDMLISILTLGLYVPRGYTITGFTSASKMTDMDDDIVKDNKK